MKSVFLNTKCFCTDVLIQEMHMISGGFIYSDTWDCDFFSVPPSSSHFLILVSCIFLYLATLSLFFLIIFILFTSSQLSW